MNYKLVFEGHLLDLLAVYCWWISLKSAQMMVLAGYPDTRLDFRRSLGPPREKTAGRVSAYRVCDVNLKLMIYASLPNTGNGKGQNTKHMLYFASWSLWCSPWKSAETRTGLRCLHWSCISKVWSAITTEMDLTIVSFTLAVNNHRCM